MLELLITEKFGIMMKILNAKISQQYIFKKQERRRLSDK